MGMFRSVATLHEIVTPTTLSLPVHALCMNRATFVFVEDWAEVRYVGLGLCKCSTWYDGQAEPENEGGEKMSSHFRFSL